VTKPFQSLRLTFSPQLASALNTIDVFEGCLKATPPTP